MPKGPEDTAAFASSGVTDVSISAGVEVDGIVFDPGASAFTINTRPGVVLTISGEGVTNDSGVLQNFVNPEEASNSGEMHFTDNATAGESVIYTNQTTTLPAGRSPLIQFEDNATASSAQFYNQAGNSAAQSGRIEFQGHSTAANGTFRNTGSATYLSPGINFRDQASAGQAAFTNETGASGWVTFFDTSTADHATITNEAGYSSSVFFYNESTTGNATVTNQGGDFYDHGFGQTYFYDNSTAGNGTFITDGAFDANFFGFGQVVFFETSKAGTGTFVADGGHVLNANGGLILLTDSATAENGIFYANGGQVPGARGGFVDIQDAATAEAGTFYANGATVEGALGGRVKFAMEAPTAATATLIATGGVGIGEGEGGGIVFRDSSVGGAARVELYGNGFLDLRVHDAPGLTIGSLEGDGLVFLGNSNLSVGSNGLSTLFSGVIQDGAGVTASSLTKVGPGMLALTGANTYSGPTVIQGGQLLINNKTGLAMGHGPVTVNAGTLGGRGPIAGTVTVGTGTGAGAALAPRRIGGKPAVLTLQDTLTFNSDATCVIHLSAKAGIAAQIAANGVTIDGAQFSLVSRGQETLAPNTLLTVISNTSTNPIDGTFTNLPDGATITVWSNTFQASYEGGDGNDFTLTVVGN